MSVEPFSGGLAGTTSSSALWASGPWYSDSKIGRDRSHILEDTPSKVSRDSSLFVVMTRYGMLHFASDGEISPCYLPSKQVEDYLASQGLPSLESIAKPNNDKSMLLAWVGQLEDKDYWVLCLATLEHVPSLPLANLSVKGLRDFGDRLSSRTDAGILATANGLVEFHKSHGFCSNCGGQTLPQKAGACRRCASCKRTVYPRLDVATIMLITSPCGQYALLGRKAGWPKGRYSTLAGFAEVGETLEECCIRETMEESGVRVDPDSVVFVASQPWPFPRSLMVGFHANALPTEGEGSSRLPTISVDPEEMEDVQWLEKSYVRDHLGGGSTARDFVPNDKEAELHIPGKSSLARFLITRWTES